MMIRWIRYLLLLIILCLGGSLMAQSNPLARIFPTYCHGFDPTGRYVITDSGTYTIETGEKFFFTTDGETLPIFSESGRLVAFGNQVYDAVTLEPLFETETPIITFSPDEQFAVDAKSVYQGAEGEMRFVYNGTEPEFSPDSHYFMTKDDSVYDLATGDALYSIWGYDPVFSPDSQYIGTNQPDVGYQVVNAKSGEVLLTIESANYFPINLMGFSHDGAWVYVPYDHVYEIANGSRVVTFEATGYSGTFSLDDDFLIASNGLYNTTTWERLVNVTRWMHPSGTIAMDHVTDVYHAPSRSVLFTVDPRIGYLEFSTDGRYIVTSTGVYDIEARSKILYLDIVERSGISEGAIHLSLSPASDLLMVRLLHSGCVVYDYTETDWVQNYGILMTEENTNIRKAPSINAGIRASDITPGFYFITGVSRDGAWYRILLDDEASWVAAERVEVLYDPGAISVVN